MRALWHSVWKRKEEIVGSCGIFYGADTRAGYETSIVVYGMRNWIDCACMGIQLVESKCVEERYLFAWNTYNHQKGREKKCNNWKLFPDWLARVTRRRAQTYSVAWPLYYIINTNGVLGGKREHGWGLNERLQQKKRQHAHKRAPTGAQVCSVMAVCTRAGEKILPECRKVLVKTLMILPRH